MMYRIIEGRSTGKTLRLMLLAKENNGVLVCSNPHAMRQKAIAYGLTGFDIISYEDYFGNISEYKQDKSFVDELETYFTKYLGANLGGYSISLED